MNARQHPLHFLPLGGAGEIGMNLNLYEYAGSWLMCDLGVTFAGDELPGIDLVMPDISFIERRRGKLLGLILTHAHEDHLGAVPYLWPRLRCPVYATPFTAALLNAKLDEGADGIEDIEITEVPLGGTVTLGPFRVELFSLTHSIPEPNALIVHTPVGTVMHTGDWKLDPDPLISASGGRTGDPGARRRRNPRHGVRFHERLPTRKLGLRSRCPHESRRTGRQLPRTRGDHDIREQPHPPPFFPFTPQPSRTAGSAWLSAARCGASSSVRK